VVCLPILQRQQPKIDPGSLNPEPAQTVAAEEPRKTMSNDIAVLLLSIGGGAGPTPRQPVPELSDSRPAAILPAIHGRHRRPGVVASMPTGGHPRL
jgi:hypothetical protein